MLRWPFGFLLLAVLAGVLGFSPVAATSAGLAKGLFTVFLALFVITLVAVALGGKKLTGQR